MKTKIAVMFGGKSVEHEVSVISAIQAIGNMNREKYDILPVYISKTNEMYIGDGVGDIEQYKHIDQLIAKSQRVILISSGGKPCLLPYPLKRFGKNQEIAVDLAFPIVHGTNEEDGTLQGYLKTVGIPFVGCDTISSANCMDKEITHTILEAHGIKMAKWLVVNHEKMQQFEQFAQQAEEKLGYPMFVKPANAGSSVGVGKAHNRQELKAACETALKEDYKAVVEECIEMQEVETAVLGNADAKAAGVVGELVPVGEFYTYEAKYIDGTTGLHIPGRVSEETSLKLRQTAEKAFAAIGCEGFARIDFFVRKSDGEVILNEINTIPGFTSISMYPKLWDYCGLHYPQLLDRLIQLGLQRK